MLPLLLAGCVSSSVSLDPSLVGDIPAGANVVEIHSTAPPEDLYRALYQHLATEGYEIKESSESMMTLSTEYNEVGQETMLAVRGVVIDEQEGSRALLRGRWTVSQGQALFTSMMVGTDVSGLEGQRAEWKQRHRAGVAFGQLAALAKDLPHERISYKAE